MLSSHKLSGRNYFAFKRALHNIFDATLICGSKLTLCTDECSWGYGLIKSCKLCLWFDLFPDDGFPNSNLWLKENDGVSSAQVLVEYARVLMLFSQHRFCGYSWSCHKFFPPYNQLWTKNYIGCRQIFCGQDNENGIVHSENVPCLLGSTQIPFSAHKLV